jgi:hypothetical protein
MKQTTVLMWYIPDVSRYDKLVAQAKMAESDDPVWDDHIASTSIYDVSIWLINQMELLPGKKVDMLFVKHEAAGGFGFWAS